MKTRIYTYLCILFLRFYDRIQNAVSVTSLLCDGNSDIISLLHVDCFVIQQRCTVFKDHQCFH